MLWLALLNSFQLQSESERASTINKVFIFLDLTGAILKLKYITQNKLLHFADFVKELKKVLSIFL